jgi:hypothetical protein
MYDKADPPDEGRCGSFFVTAILSYGRRSAETRPATKCYNVLQNHRKKCSGAVCLKYSGTDERRVFFGRPFLGRVPQTGRSAPPHCIGTSRAARRTSGWLPSAAAERFWPWSLSEQKVLTGTVFATFRFEKTGFWLY